MEDGGGLEGGNGGGVQWISRPLKFQKMLFEEIYFILICESHFYQGMKSAVCDR